MKSTSKRPRVQLGSRGFRVLGMILLVTASGFALWSFGCWVTRWVGESPLFDLRLVEVSGHRTLSPDEVRSLCPLGPDARIFEVDVHEVGRLVEGHPRIRKATVMRKPPDRLLIRVVERLPVAQVMADRWYEIDETGVVLGPVRARFKDSLPRFLGLAGNGALTSGLRLEDDHTARLLALLAALEKPPLGRSWLEGQLSVFLLSDDGGLAVPLGVGSATVLLGREDWIGRLRKLALVEACAKQSGPEAIMIDLRFENQVVVGPMPSWGEELARANLGA